MIEKIKSTLSSIQQDLDSIQEMLEGLPEENSGWVFKHFDKCPRCGSPVESVHSNYQNSKETHCTEACGWFFRETLEKAPEENSGKTEEDPLESYQLVREDPDTGYLYYERGYKRVKERS